MLSPFVMEKVQTSDNSETVLVEPTSQGLEKGIDSLTPAETKRELSFEPAEVTEIVNSPHQIIDESK